VNLRKNQGVRLSAHTDLFMRGVTHAVIASVGRKWVTIEHDESRTKHRMTHIQAKDWLMDMLGNMLATGRPAGEYNGVLHG